MCTKQWKYVGAVVIADLIASIERAEKVLRENLTQSANQSIVQLLLLSSRQCDIELNPTLIANATHTEHTYTKFIKASDMSHFQEKCNGTVTTHQGTSQLHNMNRETSQ